MNRSLAIAALILGAVSLPACGLTGDLKRPDPLWGEPSDGAEAELPEGQGASLPKLPSREDTSEDDGAGEDELLGGPED